MARTAEALEAHLRDDLIPWWRDHAVDSGRGFHETLWPDGSPGPETERRLRTVTRMLYAFSVGARLGVPGASALADDAFEHLKRAHGDTKHGGFFRTASTTGAPLDRTKDTYDHAFAVLALTEHAASRANDAARALATETATLVASRLTDETHGGFFEGGSEDWTPLRTGPRHQNPQMHWVEALLALHAHTGEARWLEGADALVALCSERFVDARRGTLGERFGTRWEPADARSGAPPGGDLIEPGHHYEWVWLLARHADAGGRTPGADLPERLFSFAESHGRAGSGHVVDAVHPDGRAARETQRLWPQTERLKALAVRGDLEALRAGLDLAFHGYATPRGWHEELGPGGAPTDTRQRATSLYHVVLGLLEARDALARASS